MTTVTTACGKCGAKMSEDGSCPACLLETGLGLLVGEIDGAVDAAPALSGSVAAHAARIMTQFADYELLEEIGRGGQGDIHRTLPKRLNTIDALTVSRPAH